MGRASRIKKTERERRELQAATAPKKSGTRNERRRNEREGVVLLHDPNTTFKLKYDISTPGGPLRDRYPAQHSGMITAETEADLLRGAIVKVIEAFGYTAYARAVTGVLAEAINPLSMPLRQMLLMQIAQGSGLLVTEEMVTICEYCEAEQEIINLLPPTANDDEEEKSLELEQKDVTKHTAECATQVQYAKGDDEYSTVAEPVWKQVPAVMVNHPFRYAPVMTPSNASEQPGNVVEVGESGVDEEGNIIGDKAETD